MHCETAVGEAVERPGGKRFVFIHPDRFAQVVRAHRERPLAIAAFLHGVAVHELTHIDGLMGEGHTEEFVSRREDLGAATAHLLPAVSVLVGKLLGLPEKVSEEGRRAARLERQVAELRAGAREAKRALATSERERAKVAAELEAARAVGARGSPGRGRVDAERLLDAAAEVLRARPPVGVDPEYVDGFIGRRRADLVGVVRAALQ